MAAIAVFVVLVFVPAGARRIAARVETAVRPPLSAFMPGS
jgi:hypothetical protein